MAKDSNAPVQEHAGRKRVALRPTIAADLAHVIEGPLPFRVRALTALAGDAVIGVGGLAFPPDGTVWAFVQQTPEAKHYPVAFHRAGLMAMRMARDLGLTQVVATADADSAVAQRWLKRLGFAEAGRTSVAGQAVFVWQNAGDSPPVARRFAEYVGPVEPAPKDRSAAPRQLESGQML